MAAATVAAVVAAAAAAAATAAVVIERPSLNPVNHSGPTFSWVRFFYSPAPPLRIAGKPATPAAFNLTLASAPVTP